MLVVNVEAQYLVKLDEKYVGFRNQTPLSIIAHLTKTWVKVQNHKKVSSTDAFKFLWETTLICTSRCTPSISKKCSGQ